MPMIIAGLLLLWLSSVLLRGFVKADPTALARWARKGGGTLALCMSVLMILRGEFNLALLAAGAGLWLLKARPGFASGDVGPGMPRWRRPQTAWRPTAGARSRCFDLMVEPATGRVAGRFRAGPYAGWTFDQMSEGQMIEAYRWCQSVDPSAAIILAPYLDRRFPGWRETTDFRGDPRSAGSRRGAARPARMPDHEAYHVLGLAEGASREEIARAHRRLMKEHHPDHGGSTDMAARVNEAKDVLMRRHP